MEKKLHIAVGKVDPAALLILLFIPAELIHSEIEVVMAGPHTPRLPTIHASDGQVFIEDYTMLAAQMIDHKAIKQRQDFEIKLRAVMQDVYIPEMDKPAPRPHPKVHRSKGMIGGPKGSTQRYNKPIVHRNIPRR